MTNKIAFGPTTSDPGNPSKLMAANEAAMKSRNKTYQDALKNSEKQAQKDIQLFGKKKEANLTSNTTPTTSNTVKNSEGFLSRNMNRVGRLYGGTSKYGRAGQIAAIGGTLAAGLGAGYLYNKNKEK